MTTTAAATTNSASTSTPNDSPRLRDNDAASDSIAEHKQQLQHHQEHNHFEQKDPNNRIEERQSPSADQVRQDHPEQQSPDNNNAPISTSSTTATTTNLTTTTATSSPTAASIANETPADNQIRPEQSPSSQQQQSTTNSGTNNNTEQKRPMNAFLLFCKRQRSLVREKYPNLENRGITKILGDWWSKLDKDQKSKYTDLARQHKEAFMKANPDFKWCKTPSVSNININANNEGFNSNSQPHQQNHNLQSHQQNHHPSIAANVEMLSLQSIHHKMDIVHHSTTTVDLMLANRQHLEAPKPPKKRFLERNDSIYVTKNNLTPNQHDSNSHGTDVVPYISLDQDTLDRVIDHAFAEESSNSPSGLNTCKCSNRNSTNFISSSDTNPTSFSSSSSTSAYNASIDEPVDFSMNRTINTTRQQIINNLVEKMLSKSSDDSSGVSNMNGTDSVKVQSRPPVKKDNPDDT